LIRYHSTHAASAALEGADGAFNAGLDTVARGNGSLLDLLKLGCGLANNLQKMQADKTARET
jgi:hypothetical protein